MAGRSVIIARHGETELNRLGIVQGSGINPGLNEFGEAQAAALHSAFEGQFDLIVSSGMLRAAQTASPFRADDSVPYVEVPDLKEICWGAFEGKVAEPWMRTEYAALMAAWESGNYEARHPGGESAQELGDRMWAGWQEVLRQDFRRALVVTHGRAMRCLICLIDGKPLSEMNAYQHANAGYYEVVESDGRWVVERHNQTDHLASLIPSKAGT